MAHTIKLTRCRDCGQHRFPALPACPFCFSVNADAVDSSGAGTLWTFTVAHRALPEFAKELPFAVGIVELDEAGSLKMLGRVIGCEMDALKIGQRVELASYAPERNIYSFRPVA